MPLLQLNDIEIQHSCFIPTYNLLKMLSSTYKNYKFFFCVGSDLVHSIKDWKPDGPKLLQEFEFIIMTRPNYIIDTSYLPQKHRIINTNIDGSSTEIRKRIKKNYDKKHNTGLINNRKKKNFGINALTSMSVIEYIKQHNLYDSKEQKEVVLTPKF